MYATFHEISPDNLESTHLCMMDCRIDENGVTPIPVATMTACLARKKFEAGAPKGPSM